MSAIGGAVRASLVVVSTPSVHLHPRVVRAHEPVGVQALRPELAVEALDEALSVGLPGREKSSTTPF
ncbi:hypothetical protein J2X65_005167 [Ancylobacter sp. 3268]|nr:hypothetical protein [Ancylobacter sp. 3268]